MNFVAFKDARAVLLTLAVVLLSTGAACKRSADNSQANGNASNANSQAAADETQATPPFPTKEPERYQALVAISIDTGQQESLPELAALKNQEMTIARDGEKRRSELQFLPGVKVVYLQLASGRYVLYPAQKLYAEMKMDGSNGLPNPVSGVPADFSPDKLVNSSFSGARYEKLGTEEVGGRMTTKYRVTWPGADASREAPSEAFIWADESLGMPIKVETTPREGAKYTTEWRDIKLDVDPALFELPKNYKKVTHEELTSKLTPSIDNFIDTLTKPNKKMK